MKRATTPSQRAVSNIRSRIRKDMQVLALTHRGCSCSRGCGCLVDLALGALERCERLMFDAELYTMADPSSPRREVQADNSILISAGTSAGAASELPLGPPREKL
jgi:hypothetical protein